MLYLFFYLAYVILVNNIFPIFIRSRGYGLNHKITMYIETAFIMLVFIVVYRISLTEDYGLLSPRLHFRYFEPLFVPYTICFIARLYDGEEESSLDNKYVKLALGIFLFVLLLIPAINAGGSLDSTTYMFYLIPDKLADYLFLGSPRKTVIMNMAMKILILVVVLLEVKLFNKNKKWFTIAFLSIAFVINIVGLCLKYADLRLLYKLPERYLNEMQTINDELDDLEGDKLLIVRDEGRLPGVAVTFYDINSTDIYLANDEYKSSDKEITLKAVNATNDVNTDDYDYIVYDNNIWEDAERDSIPSDKVVLSTDNFFIYDNR